MTVYTTPTNRGVAQQICWTIPLFVIDDEDYNVVIF